MSAALLALPVAVGVAAGLFLAYSSEPGPGPGALLPSALADGGSPVLGSPDAPITILEWGDYQCTFCYRFHKDTLGMLDRDYIQEGLVKVVFKDYPLNGPGSVLAAEASYCAEDQGMYWEYHDEIYANWAGERTGWLNRDSLERFAGTVGLDAGGFAECLDSGRHAGRVAELHRFGMEIGIDATPSFLVFSSGGIVKITGNQPPEAFVRAIDGLRGQN